MPIFIFSQYKSMATIVAIATRILIRLGQKTILFVPPAYRWYKYNMVRTGFMASEMSFENVDDDANACLYYKLTYEPLAQVSYRYVIALDKIYIIYQYVFGIQMCSNTL